jgi:DNA-binding response OmpR family regulator
MWNPFPVLVVTAHEADHDLFELFLGGVGYTVHHAWTLAEAIRILQEFSIVVVITERSLPDGSWIGVQVSSDLPCKPPLVIVFRDAGDATFWAQAFNLGAFDVLHRPLAETIVARAVNLANLRWSRAVEEHGAGAANPGMFPTVATLMIQGAAEPQPCIPVSSTGNGSRRNNQHEAARA